MWRDNRDSVRRPLRLALLVAGIALIFGYLTAGVGGKVEAKPGPAVLAPATDAPSLTPVKLQLREVSVPSTLRPASRAKRSKDRSTDAVDTSGSTDQSQSSSPAPTPTKP